jgi:hypothetical protein
LVHWYVIHPSLFKQVGGWFAFLPEEVAKGWDAVIQRKAAHGDSLVLVNDLLFSLFQFVERTGKVQFGFGVTKIGLNDIYNPLGSEDLQFLLTPQQTHAGQQAR